MEGERAGVLKGVRRVVVKVGSSLLTGPEARGLRTRFVTGLAAQIRALQEEGREAAVVTSGAIASGLAELGWRRRPVEVPRLQALAAVGQSNLMHAYESSFRRHGLKVAQVLLTHDDLSNRRRFTNARNTLTELFRSRIVPVVNENDTVAVREIKFGDNDELAALLCDLVDADLLVLLTDAEGLHWEDPRVNPRAGLVREVRQWSADLDRLAGAAGSRVGTGGMASKLAAARRLTAGGIPVAVAPGRCTRVLLRLLAGEPVGTLFHPRGPRLTARKRWLSGGVQPRGDLIVDEGAERALRERHTSLLPSGIREVRGHFAQGDPVRILGPGGREIGRGVTNYASSELEKIRGRRSQEIVEVLGYKMYDEAVHRDHMALGG